ncbi:uncharacterized protein F5147DRAFT_582567, partial [Suillus discolor]
ASNRENAVLELDETREKLSLWHWPVNDDGERVVPSDLVVHRRSHQFQGPWYLCALGGDNDPSDHREAVIIMLTRGAHVGEYVACCTSSKCGYIGRLSLAG